MGIIKKIASEVEKIIKTDAPPKLEKDDDGDNDK